MPSGFFRNKYEREELVSVALELFAVMDAEERHDFLEETKCIPLNAVPVHIAVEE